MSYILLTVISLLAATSLSAGGVDYSASVQVYKGSYLFAKVQDNGQSCVYSKNYKEIIIECKGCDDSDKPKVPGRSAIVPVEYVFDSSVDTTTIATSIIARSIATDDVIDTLQELYGNDRKYHGLFDLAQGVLTGKHAIHRGTLHYYNLMEMIGEKLEPIKTGARCLIACTPPYCPPCARGEWHPRKTELVKQGTPDLEVIAKVAKETTSSGSVSCPGQP